MGKRWPQLMRAVLIALVLVGAGGLSGVAQAAAGLTPSHTLLTVTPNPATSAQLVTLFATVRTVPAGGAAPTGTVTFTDGTTSLGTAPIATSAKGRQFAEIKTHFARGTHSLTAAYSGDASTGPSTSAAVTLKVSQAAATATTTSVTEVAGQSAHSVIIRTAVKDVVKGSGPATGTAKFIIDGKAPQTVTLNSTGRAHLTVTLAPGTHHAVVHYSGDSNHKASSGSLTFTST